MQIIEFMKAHEEVNGREFNGAMMTRKSSDRWPELRLRPDARVQIAGGNYTSSVDEGLEMTLDVIVRVDPNQPFDGRRIELTLPVQFFELVPEGDPVDYEAKFQAASAIYNRWRETHQGVHGLDQVLLGWSE